MILECTVAELAAGEGAVVVGQQTVSAHQLIDALSRGSAEVEGWQRFEEAGQALNDMRHAAARYITALNYVRARVEVSPALRRRIATFGANAKATLERELADLDTYRRDERDHDPADPARLQANATPAMVAARHALDSQYDIEGLAWAWRARAVKRAADREQ